MTHCSSWFINTIYVSEVKQINVLCTLCLQGRRSWGARGAIAPQYKYLGARVSFCPPIIFHSISFRLILTRNMVSNLNLHNYIGYPWCELKSDGNGSYNCLVGKIQILQNFQFKTVVNLK